MEVIPERGDIWWVALDPTLGSEIRKARPCVIISVRVLNDRRRTLGAPQKLTTSTRIDLTTPKTDRATWHGDGRYLPHPRRRRVSR